MLFGKYQFHSILEKPASLPPFKGSTFRGVFGIALRKVVCALKRQECTDCLLRDRCVYSLVFETPSGNFGQDLASGKPSPPHPFVIEPPLSEETDLPEGADFNFALILFGQANDYLPYFVYAFEQMGEIGIGRRMGGKRANFRLQRITSGGTGIYDARERRLANGLVSDLVLEDTDPSTGRPPEITILLETPLRLKYQNHLQVELPFHILVRAMLRRLAALNECYGSGEPPLDYRGLVARAQEIRTIDSKIRWYDWERYSNRQERSMLLGGMVGEVTYGGELGEFMPLIRYVEKVHLGKATTFGLGQIRLSHIN